MASCKNDFLCILVKVLIIATYGEYCFHLRKSLLWKFMLQPYSNVWPFCLGKKPLFFSFVFFPKSPALYKIYLLGQNIGTQCYGGLINILLAGGTVLWFVTLQAHTCTSYKCHEKLCKTEQTWTTHKSHKCTYIYHQKLNYTVLILKRRGICERVTLSLFAQIVWVQQLQSSKRIITFDVKIYHLFSLNHHVWFTANCLRVLKIIYFQNLIISYSVHIV